MIGKSSLPVTGLPAESSTVPSGTISTGALLGAFSRLSTLIGCGVPSINSGGISVVSGMLPALAAALGARCAVVGYRFVAAASEDQCAAGKGK